MAFLPMSHLTQKEIKENFDHYGLVFGFIPVYIRLNGPEEPADLAVRNWFPEWPMDVIDALFLFFSGLAQTFLNEEDGGVALPIRITGNIK